MKALLHRAVLKTHLAGRTGLGKAHSLCEVTVDGPHVTLVSPLLAPAAVPTSRLHTSLLRAGASPSSMSGPAGWPCAHEVTLETWLHPEVSVFVRCWAGGPDKVPIIPF